MAGLHVESARDRKTPGKGASVTRMLESPLITALIRVTLDTLAKVVLYKTGW